MSQGWVFKSESPRRDFLSGKQTKEERFLVWGYTAATIIDTPQEVKNASNQGLPGIGSGGIGGSTGGVKLDAYTVNARDDGMVDAVATFSNFGYGRFPSDPIQERIGYANWAGDNWIGEIEFPVARRRDVIDETVDVSFINETWEPTTFKIRMGYERVRYRATTATFGAAERAILRSQNGKLHLINDGGVARYYQFEVGGYSEQAGGGWHIDYSWMREEGVPQLTKTVDAGWTPGDTTGSVFIPPTWTASQIQAVESEWGETQDDKGAEARWMIPPYHVLNLTVNTQLPLGEQPRYSALLGYDIANNGWMLLPGIEP